MWVFFTYNTDLYLRKNVSQEVVYIKYLQKLLVKVCILWFYTPVFWIVNLQITTKGFLLSLKFRWLLNGSVIFCIFSCTVCYKKEFCMLFYFQRNENFILYSYFVKIWKTQEKVFWRITETAQRNIFI